MIWLFPPLSLASILSLLVFLCVARRAYWRVRGGGAKSYDGEKAWCSIDYNPLLAIVVTKDAVLAKSTIVVIRQCGLQFRSWFLTNRISHNYCIMKCENSSQMQNTVLFCHAKGVYLWFFVDVNYNYMKLKHRVHFTGLVWQKQNLTLCNI
jgi:hypothetical protein